MIRFSIGRIPVEVHVSHLLFSGFIAMGFVQSGARDAWPGTVLGNPSHPQHTFTLVLCMAIWMAMITGSVLVHELGHASVARRYGFPVSIHFFGILGLTRAPGSERLSWRRDLVFTLAGPAAGLTLGLSAKLLLLALDQAGAAVPAARYVLGGLSGANLFWAVVNLLPIATLDGGRVAATVLTRLLGRPGFLVAQVLSLGLVALIGLVGVFAIGRGGADAGDLLWVLLVVMLATRTFANINAYRRGELPLGEGAHPLQAVLERAEALYRDGKLAEAEPVAKDLVAADAPSSLKVRAHYLLGWIFLKKGNGALALQHFSQVQGIEVPPHALAAAFSLAGDEARAIPLWARAAQQHQDEVILHEFAGALIRAGRETEARRIPGVRPALAFTAAERVHFVRGEFARAAQAAEEAFREEVNPATAYDAACAWARAGDGASAMRMLTLAAQNGFRNAGTAAADPDLTALRGTPQFEGWLESLRKTAAS